MKFTTRKKGFTAGFALIALIAMAVSAQAPQVTLRTLDGDNFSPASQRGKVIVLSFGATYVPMASKELPALQKLADRYSGRGAEVYWVSVNSTKPGARYTASDAEIRDFAQKAGLRIGVLRDPEQSAYRAFSGEGLPALVVIGRDGQIVLKRTGFDPNQPEPFSDVIRALDQLLK